MNCCITVCDKPLDENFWDGQWKSNTIGWDIGFVSPPIASLIDLIDNKSASILIPGCGSGYEAEYLLSQGFTNISLIDISESACNILQKKFNNNSNITIIHGDFFKLDTHFDLIIEQTFFCAIPPQWRTKYLWKMHQLLNKNGILMGLFFNRTFEAGPPFGGNEDEYRNLFQAAFEFEILTPAINSIEPRKNSELQFLYRKNEVSVKRYEFLGITCNGCRTEIEEKIKDIPNVLNATINSDFSEIIVVSNNEIPLDLLNQKIAYDAKYKIQVFTE
jgi:SAM-dependent methyltransferase